MTKYCRKCGEKVNIEDEFCPNCGEALSDLNKLHPQLEKDSNELSDKTKNQLLIIGITIVIALLIIGGGIIFVHNSQPTDYTYNIDDL